MEVRENHRYEDLMKDAKGPFLLEPLSKLDHFPWAAGLCDEACGS